MGTGKHPAIGATWRSSPVEIPDGLRWAVCTGQLAPGRVTG